MTRIIALLIFILLFTSCYVRISTKANKVQPVTNDSILVLSIKDETALLDTTFLIATTSIKSPFQGWLSGEPHYTRLLTYAKNEAKKTGGNVIKVTDYHNYLTTKYFSSKLTANIYSFKDSVLLANKIKADPLNIAHKNSIKNICTIHLKNICTHYGGRWSNDELFFNDSSVCHFRSEDGSKKSYSLNLIFEKDGILSSKLITNADKYEKVNLKLGEEYYIIIYNPKRESNAKSSSFGINTEKVYFGLVSKDVFENEGKR